MRICFGILPAAVLAVALVTVSADMEQCEAGSDSCSSERDRFVRPGYEKKVAELTKPIVQYLKENGKLEEDSLLERWDGVNGTALEHAKWIIDHGKDFTSKDKEGFEFQGEHKGIKYEINKKFTELGGGDGYFRLSGVVDLSPDEVIHLVNEPKYLGAMDATMVLTDVLKTYKDERTTIALWIANPGFPFTWRDGMDISTWSKDENGVIWQAAVSVPFVHPSYAWGSIRAIDRYWAYRLAPVSNGEKTDVTLICQTSLNGWMPKPLVNYMVGQVLSDYIRTLESFGKSLRS